MTAGADINGLILDQLRKISEEVRRIPKIEAQVEAMREVTIALSTAMRETTAGLQTQAVAHGKQIGELQRDIQRIVAGITQVNDSMTGLMARVKDLEAQVRASFTQQQSLARDVRDFEERDSMPALVKHLDAYGLFEKKVDALTVIVQELAETIKEFPEFLPWLHGLRWFLRAFFYLLALAGSGGLMWLLAKAILNQL